MQTLFEVLQDAATPQEKNVIILQISTVSNAHVEFVNALEEQILTALDESQDVSALLLALGALASNARPEVEYEVATFLLGLQERLTSMISSNNTSELVHLILAMGNTGSDYVVTMILSYVDSLVEEVQRASIRALLKFTHLEQVTDRLAEVLEMDLDEETVILITHTIVKGHKYYEDRDIEMSPEANYPLLQSLVSAVLRFNNTDLKLLVATYLHEAGGEQGFTLMDELQIRSKRGSDWDASGSEYDLVASRSSRQSDVITYPRHKAYIWGKTHGISKANLKTAAGAFFGTTNNCEYMKGYSKVYAECNVLSRKKILADVEILLQKTGITLRGRVYAEINGNTLVNNDHTVDRSRCYTYNTPLSRSRSRFYRFTYSIFVYVGTVDLSVSLYLGMSINFDAQACVGLSESNVASGTSGIVPQISLSVAGSASVTLLVSPQYSGCDLFL